MYFGWKMLVHFMAIWNIYFKFNGYVFGNFVCFSSFGYIVPRKIWELWLRNGMSLMAF
jgi:hypothetical protein